MSAQANRAKGSPSDFVTVIVPTRNSASHLPNCLASIRSQTHEAIELIVVDNHSSDDTRTIAAEYADCVLIAGPERSGQRNVGACSATGSYVFFIDSDMVLEPDVVAECVNQLRDSSSEAVVVPEVSFGNGFWARCKAFERSFYVGDDLIEAARFFRADVIAEVGGFDDTLPPGPEDWDLDERVRRRGHPVARVPALIRHYEGDVTLLGLMRKKFYYGRGMPAYVRKHPSRARAQLRLVRPAFTSGWRRLAANPSVAAGMLFMKTCEFAAGGAGFAFARFEEIRCRDEFRA
jgi:glycosyltransferase involved in cell wall biosynthesis